MVDFNWQLICTVLAFIKSVFVNIEFLYILPSLCTSIEVLGYHVQNIDSVKHHDQSLRKILHLLK